MTNPNAHVPDILDTISNLSNDEVFTPPDVANAVLDLLPPEVWTDSSLTFLDPASKTGIFLREAARRLMVGLEIEFPDEQARREHIFKNMLFGFPITELTGLMCRRSVYYSKDASSDHSVVKFDDEDGNFPFTRLEHSYAANDKCTICGSPREQLERGEGRENHAYRFIHDKEVENMQFDVIVGNPPYQLQDGGAGPSASPIYQLFVNQAFRLKPRYVSMIIPSRWFAGGKGLDSFREQMLASKHFRNLSDFPAAADLFPTVEIKGGVCYFLWDSTYEGPCEVKTYKSGQLTSESTRYLGEHGDIFIRWSEALPILAKVQEQSDEWVDEQVAPSKPFGLRTFFSEYEEREFDGAVELYGNGGKFFVKPSQIPINTQWINKWKVLTSNGYNGGDALPHQILGTPILAGPNAACTETYIVCGIYDTEHEAKNFESYMRTRFFRFLVALRKNTQHVTQGKFKFVPKLDMNVTWDDEKLYEKFEITESEQEFIASIVRAMSSKED